MRERTVWADVYPDEAVFVPDGSPFILKRFAMRRWPTQE
jgi:hypothetical protein